MGVVTQDHNSSLREGEAGRSGVQSHPVPHSMFEDTCLSPLSLQSKWWAHSKVRLKMARLITICNPWTQEPRKGRF